MSGDPMSEHQSGENSQHISTVESPVHFNRQTLPAVLVDHGHQLQGSAVVGPIEHEVVGPDVVLMLGSQPYAASVVQPQASALRLFLGHFQPFLPPDTSHPLHIDFPSFRFEQSGDPPVAVATILLRQLDNPSR